MATEDKGGHDCVICASALGSNGGTLTLLCGAPLSHMLVHSYKSCIRNAVMHTLNLRAIASKILLYARLLNMTIMIACIQETLP